MILFLLVGMEVGAATLPVEDLIDKLEETKSKIVERDRHQRLVLGSLYQINRRMRDMTHKRSQLTNEVMAAEGDVSNLAREIAVLEKRVEEQRSDLSRRLRTIYMMNGQAQMRLMFSSLNANDMDRTLRYLKAISDRDYQMIRRFETSLKLLTARREKLKGRVEKLVNLKGRLKNQEELLSEEQKHKSQLVVRLKANSQKDLEQIEGLRRKTRSLAGGLDPIVEKALEFSFFERKGSLPAPVHAPVTRGFGFIEHETYRYRLSHKGLFYALPPGSPVHAVFSGRVSFADELPGWGLTVIVNHGDHYYTVYAHNSQLQAKPGDEVEEGKVVALSGQPVHLSDAGLYFEIRHFSEAVDPMIWMAQSAIK